MKAYCGFTVAWFVVLGVAAPGAPSADKYPIGIGAKPPKDATVLFDGKDFSQWLQKGENVKWKLLDDGATEVVPGTGSIFTKDDYEDFRLHIEFNCPIHPPEVTGQKRGNSGVYIQRRYEIQILDSYGLDSQTNDCGGIYKVATPLKNVCKKPGEWQSYDITFHAPRWEGEGKEAKKVKNARVTVCQNGVLIHDDVDIPNKTGGGRAEGPEPGPILLQDHKNKVRFRNIWIVPLGDKEK